MLNSSTFLNIDQSDLTTGAGFRFGDRGTQARRTIMLSELTDLFEAIGSNGSSVDYTNAIVDDNVLGKQTYSNRRLTNQALRELYGLDPDLPIFRVLRRIWDIDRSGHQLLAMLCSLSRDPLLRSTGAHVLSLPVGTDLLRGPFVESIRHDVGSRLNDYTIDVVARNAGSSWSQSGHLHGRTKKTRTRAETTFGPVAMALWMGSLEELSGEELLRCRWLQVLDVSQGELIDLIFQARQARLLSANIGGGVVDIDVSILDRFSGGL